MTIGATPKPDHASYFTLADALKGAGVDQVSLEDAHRHSELARLERFARKTVVLGNQTD